MPKMTHEDYWKARTDEILRYVDKTDLDIYKELIKLYTEAATDIQKELYAFVLKYAEENNLTYREALKQLRDTDLSDYRENAKRYFEESKKNPELLKRLNEQYVSSKATRMDAMNLEIEYRLGILKQTVEGTFEDYLKKTALYTYSKIGRGFNSSPLNEKVLIKLIQTPFNGANYAESVGLNVDELAKSIKEVLRVGFIKGSHPRVMAQELMKKVNISRSRAQTIIRTDGTMVINNSIAQRYIDAGLKHYRILVHMDDRTTKICRKHHKDNKVYDLKDFEPGITAPPFHYNCRSAIIPDKDELNEDIENNQGKHNEVGKNEKYISSGKHGALNNKNDPNNVKRSAFANQYYESVRNRDKENEINRISKNTGIDKRIIKKVYNHVFINEYLLYGDKLQRFDPDYDMAQSWQRLFDGKSIEKHDIILVKHEYHESILMENGMDYVSAHNIVSEKYDYLKALVKWQMERGDLNVDY